MGSFNKQNYVKRTVEELFYFQLVEKFKTYEKDRDLLGNAVVTVGNSAWLGVDETSHNDYNTPLDSVQKPFGPPARTSQQNRLSESSTGHRRLDFLQRRTPEDADDVTRPDLRAV